MDVVIVAIAGGVATVIAAVASPAIAGLWTRITQRRALATPAPPSTVEVWARMDHVERVLRAALSVALKYTEEWPEGHPRPKLSRQHVAILIDEGYLDESFKMPDD